MYNLKDISDETIADRIPGVMGTQHPDNFSNVPFGSSPRVTRELEDEEVLYNVRDLSIREMMIDYEKKRGNVTPLWDWIHKCQTCMAEKEIGREWYVTPRLPNGDSERKDPYFWQSIGIFVNALLVMDQIGLTGRMPFAEFIVPNITRGATVAKTEQHIVERYILQSRQYQHYGDGARFPYEKDFFAQGIPLIESVSDLIQPEAIWDELITHRRQLSSKDTFVQRSFIARSDPALKAGMLAAHIAAVVALDRGRKYEAETGVRISQILGVGSSPFRGGLNPTGEIIGRVLDDYPGVATVTVQSAFRYDNPKNRVIDACQMLENKIRTGWLKRGQIDPAITENDIKRIGELLDTLQAYYEASYKELASVLFQIIPAIPSHRERYQDISMGGPSRQVGGLPAVRAIKFAAACYSLGLPPGLLGLRALERLSTKQQKLIETICPRFSFWVGQEWQWLNLENLSRLKQKNDLSQVTADIEAARNLVHSREPNPKHAAITREILSLMDSSEDLNLRVLKAAEARGFLG